MQERFPSADRGLAQRLEAADSAITSNLIAKTGPYAAEPAPGGGYCLFGGAGSPLTHAVGAGMLAGAGSAALDHIEHFYRSRGVPCCLDLCPLAQDEFIREIHTRPYRVIELNNILLRRLSPGDQFPANPHIHRVHPDELAEWSKVVARGFAEGAEPPAETMDALSVCAPAAHCFLAGLDGHAVAGAAMGMRDGVAWMFGDATLPDARGRGMQQALIQARLAFAAAHGCELAGAAVLPGSASHRNYERTGFQLVYMRVSVMREWPAAEVA
jgi:GNAT superfamily N-acetyltransferase